MTSHPDRRTVLAAAAFGVVGATLNGCVTAAPAGPGRWERRAPLPWVAQEIYGAVVGERVHVAGGLVGQGAARGACSTGRRSTTPDATSGRRDRACPRRRTIRP